MLIGIGTSASDNGDYPDFCSIASVNSEVFSTFKRNKLYNIILEHTSEIQGKGYLDCIKRDSPHLLDYMDIFKENDKFGDPLCFNYDNIGLISPTTLRYIKVLSDLERLYGDLSGMDIVEIGVGYGGQCLIINSLYKVKSYTLVDLPQVLSLCKRYLNNYAIYAKINFLTMCELDSSAKYDLFISNYAFSELKLDIQDCYFNKAIKNTQRGYITSNRHDGHECFTLDDYIDKIPNLSVYDEEPKTALQNKILIWNNM